MVSEVGVKHDAGKPLSARILGGFACALTEVARVGTKGYEKYPDPRNWQKVENAETRYKDAAIRHWLDAEAEGETDPESGYLHAAHFAWNALAHLELVLRRQAREGGQDYRMEDIERMLSTPPSTTGGVSYPITPTLNDASPAEWDRAARAYKDRGTD